RYVQTGRDPHPLERPLALEPLPDQQEHRHLARGPIDQVLASLREAGILDVAFPGSDAHALELLDQLESRGRPTGEARLAPTTVNIRRRGTPRTSINR